MHYWWKIKGISDDRTQCDCCGLSGLKRTVALMPLDADGNENGTAEDVVHYGTSCAAKALGWRQGKVTSAALTAQHRRNELDHYARRIISIYAPIESAPAAVQARIFLQRNRYPRPGVSPTKEVAKLLAEARAQLSAPLTGPARPARIEDFQRFTVVVSRSGSVDGVQRVPDEEDKRQEQATAAQRRAAQISGSVLVVAALDVVSAGDVAIADEVTREWNEKAWQAAHA
ncbi:hypothetical protein [Streptomyces sp. NPDC005799]|uniref:hypothetical protein n=1 Tax=Streptomyces sp. NPDC005799 TaxID=3154678 RepID=UPI00340BFE8C